MNITKLDDNADFEAIAKSRVALGGEDAAATLQDKKILAANNIVEDVRLRGDLALAEYTQKFDDTTLIPDQFELDSDTIDAAVATVQPELINTLERAYKNIYRFHSKNLRTSWTEEFEDGTLLGQKITPIESAGVYVPGGRAFYPSSVLMNIAPAKVALVPEIVMVSPPSFQGSIHPVVLAAAKIAGATRIFRVGGAQAIAALAYGTDTIPKVLKITGPGNAYVAAAKGLIQSVCAIDSEAGPSEVTVIADESANPQRIAAELLAQAEHDEDATSILITTSTELAEAVLKAIDDEIDSLSRVEIIKRSLLNNGAIYVVQTLQDAITLSNYIAPEHLAIYTKTPQDLLDKVTNAGSIMLGEATTVVFGDYIAGPNHILPTGRRARFASPLSAEDFRKSSSIISFTEDGARKVRDDVMRLATAEELTAHARAAEIRK